MHAHGPLGTVPGGIFAGADVPGIHPGARERHVAGLGCARARARAHADVNSLAATKGETDGLVSQVELFEQSIDLAEASGGAGAKVSLKQLKQLRLERQLKSGLKAVKGRFKQLSNLVRDNLR